MSSEKLKVIIMGDGYDVLDVLGHGVLLTFLLCLLSTNKQGDLYSGGRTLFDIVQNRDEWVAILTLSLKISFSITSLLTFEPSGIRVTVSHHLGGCRGRQEGVLSAARIGLVRKRIRLARKPLKKLH